MTLLVTAEQLRARARIANGALAPLAAGLRRELEPLVAGSHDVPAGKALLSRAGGRCARDGALLAYDPFDARHRCLVCGAEYTGELHDRFRLYWHHLWLAERAVHGALLGVLANDAACRDLAIDLLDGYATRYLDYPNFDNVLGPSRPFFSTYLESIWLLQLCVALDLLEIGAPSDAVAALGGRVRERVIEPSAALIASYDEGMSNRQVWNNAALLAAGSLLGDASSMHRVVHGSSGLHAHLDQALLADGSWYEGENYHLFAHRGLWYGVQIAEANGYPTPSRLDARFRDGFAAPFRTLLPDLTLPSRRDSQYAISVRQPRFAESCELGLARGRDERLTGMLARLYDDSGPHGETGRAASSADVERNMPATGLTRADLSWRSLLVALPELPPLVPTPLQSDLLPAQGLAILRRDDGHLYVALDYGHSGGGHGHPDRLNLLLVDGSVRWFDDPGTGSYVDDSLHWYRSTLAHTAPLVDGRSQRRVNGSLVAFDDDADEAVGWMAAAAELSPGLVVRRSIVVLEDYLMDCLEWEGDVPHEIALPLHGVDVVNGHGLPAARAAVRIKGGDEKEDGFGHLRDGQRITVRPGAPVRLHGSRDGIGNARLDGWMSAIDDAVWERAIAPDVPTRPGVVPMLLLRAVATRGRFLAVWSWRGSVIDAAIADDLVSVTRTDGGRDEHRFTTDGWRIERERGSRCDTIVLGGFADGSVRASVAGTAEDVAASLPPQSLPAEFTLAEDHYRRSEQSWREAGEPRAAVRIVIDASRLLRISVDVEPSHRIFVPIDAANALDNEPAAINGDGVQLYLAAGERRGGWLLVPDAGSSGVSVRPIDGWSNATALAVSATWHRTPAGWSLSAAIALPDEVPEVALDVLVNETAPDRARRRGQLVLSGARGEFVYLRGDRHDTGRLLRFIVPDA